MPANGQLLYTHSYDKYNIDVGLLAFCHF